MKLLVVYDGSEPSIKALRYTLSIADSNDELSILHVFDIESYTPLASEVQKSLDQIAMKYEAKFKKQLSNYIKDCRSKGIKINLLFKIGKVGDEVIKESIDGGYSMLIIPYCERYSEKIDYIIIRALREFKGSILIVR